MPPRLSSRPPNIPVIRDLERGDVDISSRTRLYIQPVEHGGNELPGEEGQHERSGGNPTTNKARDGSGSSKRYFWFYTGIFLILFGFASALVALTVVVKHNDHDIPMKGGPQIWLGMSAVIFLLGVLITVNIGCDLSGHNTFSAYDEPAMERRPTNLTRQRPVQARLNRRTRQGPTTSPINGQLDERSQFLVRNRRDSEETRWSMFYDRSGNTHDPNGTVPGDIARGAVPGAQGARAGRAPNDDTEASNGGDQIRHGSINHNSVTISTPVGADVSCAASLVDTQSSLSCSPIEDPVGNVNPRLPPHRRTSTALSLNSLERARRFARRDTILSTSPVSSPAWPKPQCGSGPYEDIEMQDMASSVSGAGTRGQSTFNQGRSPIPALWNVHTYERSRTNVRHVESSTADDVYLLNSTVEAQREEAVVTAKSPRNVDAGWETQPLYGGRPARKLV